MHTSRSQDLGQAHDEVHYSPWQASMVICVYMRYPYTGQAANYVLYFSTAKAACELPQGALPTV